MQIRITQKNATNGDGALQSVRVVQNLSFLLLRSKKIFYDFHEMRQIIHESRTS